MFGGKRVTFLKKDFEDIASFCHEHDPKLPQPAFPQEVILSLYKMAKRLVKENSAESELPETVESSQERVDRPTFRSPPPPPTASVRVDEDSAESGDTAEAEAKHEQRLQLIQAQVKLEEQKANTFYWKARSQGRAASRETTLVSQQASARFYCRLHGTEHSSGPCSEIIQMSKETGLPLSNPQFGYVVP